jgi:flagellar basal-body rod modification protein FlgD
VAKNMSIAGLTEIKANDATLATPAPNILGKEDFLYLLVTQLKSQDPLEPMKSTEFTAQLAQFSSLEQLCIINENLGYLQLYQASLNNSQAVAFIGKTVKASGNSIYLTDGVPDDIHFELAEDAISSFINIYDYAGNLVRTIEVGALNAGEQTIEWDGTDNEGNKFPDGKYVFEVLATDVNGDMVRTTTYITGRVTGVTFKDGITYLLVGNQEVPVGNVIQITENEG